MKTLVTLITLLTLKSYAGGIVGNGGDAAYCRPSTENKFSGYYSLDYLVQYNPDEPVGTAQSIDSSLERVEKVLREKLPELADNFHEFVINVFNTTNPTKKYYWEKTPFGLVDLKDENLVTQLPKNCRVGDQTEIVQAVIRMNSTVVGLPPDKFLFRFVPEVTEQLQSSNPVQLSFLIVHEWLWNFSDNVDRNRRINYWLHSTQVDKWTREELLKNLSAIGFSVPFLPVADSPHAEADKKVMGNCLRSQKKITESMVSLLQNLGAVNFANNFQVGICELKKGEAVLTMTVEFIMNNFYFNNKSLLLKAKMWPVPETPTITYSFQYTAVGQYDQLGNVVSYNYTYDFQNRDIYIYQVYNDETNQIIGRYNFGYLIDRK